MSGGNPSIARFAAFGFVLALVSGFGQSFFIGLFGGEVQRSLGIDPSRWGLVYGLATLASGGLMFWVGAMSDCRPLRQVLAVSLTLLATGAVLMAIASAVWMLVAALFALRFGGQGLAGHLAMVVAARPAVRRGRSLAIAAFGFVAAEAILPISVVALMGATGWRGLWWLAAAVVAGLALPALWWLAGRAARQEESADNAAVHVALGRRTLLGNPSFVAGLSVVLVSPFVVTAIFLQQATLVELKLWSLPMFASGFLLFALVQAVANWVSGALVDRFGARSLLRVYLVPLALGCLALGFVPGPWAMWLMFAGLGASAGAQSVVSGALWVELFGLRQLGMVRGVYFGFMVLATAVAPYLLGAALSAGVPLQTIGGVLAGYAVVAPWCAGAVVAARKGR